MSQNLAGAGIRRTGANKDKRHIYIKADVKCRKAGARNPIAHARRRYPHLVKTPARVMTTSPSLSPPPCRPDRITIRQPDPNKQQLPQLTDKESGAIAHGRGHPIKQPGVTVGGSFVWPSSSRPPLPPSLLFFLHRAVLASAGFH